MTSFRLDLAFGLSVLSVLSGCSAVVSPDVDRLGARPDGSPQLADGGAVDDGAVPSCGPFEVRCFGACVNLAIDPAHCGSCDIVCTSGSSCQSGVCGGCTAGDPSCGGLGDPAACGAARTACDRDQLCVGGACVCRPPLVAVSGACVDLSTDPNNCGAPGMVCADSCALGHCARACPDGTRDCDGACVDTRSDSANCGDCGRACGPSETCQGGNCRDISPARGCTTCPCAACEGRACCVLPRLDVPYCLDADRCP